MPPLDLKSCSSGAEILPVSHLSGLVLTVGLVQEEMLAKVLQNRCVQTHFRKPTLRSMSERELGDQQLWSIRQLQEIDSAWSAAFPSAAAAFPLLLLLCPLLHFCCCCAPSAVVAFPLLLLLLTAAFPLVAVALLIAFAFKYCCVL